ncbi:MAG: hypothetical protein ABIO86_05015 [Sphingomonas sp.]
MTVETLALLPSLLFPTRSLLWVRRFPVISNIFPVMKITGKGAGNILEKLRKFARKTAEKRPNRAKK